MTLMATWRWRTISRPPRTRTPFRCSGVASSVAALVAVRLWCSFAVFGGVVGILRRSRRLMVALVSAGSRGVSVAALPAVDSRRLRWSRSWLFFCGVLWLALPAIFLWRSWWFRSRRVLYGVGGVWGWRTLWPSGVFGGAVDLFCLVLVFLFSFVGLRPSFLGGFDPSGHFNVMRWHQHFGWCLATLVLADGDVMISD